MDIRDEGAFRYYFLGEKFFLNSNLDLAEEMFDIVILMDSKNTPYWEKAYLGKAAILAKKEKFSEAVAIYNKMLESDPQCASAYFYRGLTYFCNLNQIDRGSQDVFKAGAILKERQDYKAINDCTNILEEIRKNIPVVKQHNLPNFNDDDTNHVNRIDTLSEIKSLTEFIVNKNIDEGNIFDRSTFNIERLSTEKIWDADVVNSSCTDTNQISNNSEQTRFEAYYVVNASQDKICKDLVKNTNIGAICLAIALSIMTLLFSLLQKEDIPSNLVFGIMLFFVLFCILTANIVAYNHIRNYKKLTKNRELAIAIDKKGLICNLIVNLKHSHNNKHILWNEISDIELINKQRASTLVISIYKSQHPIYVIIRSNKLAVVSKKTSEICWAIEYYSNNRFKFAFDSPLDRY